MCAWFVYLADEHCCGVMCHASQENGQQWFCHLSCVM